MCKANSERILVVCHPPHRTFHQAQRQVRRKEISRKKYDFFNKGIGNFFAPSNRSLSYPTYRWGFRCHPVSQRAGVLRSGVIMHRGSPCCTVSLNKKHGKNFMGNTIVVFGMLGIFPIYPDISKNCFWPGFFVDGNAFSNLWFRKVAKVLEGSGGICKVGVLQQIWFPPSRRQLL